MLGAIGLCLALKHAPLGLCLGGALLAFASGFAAAKLRTEMARAPVLTHELRYVAVTGFVEAHELRDKGRARITLRVLTLGDIEPAQRPYRVRVSLPASDGAGARIGEAVVLHATPGAVSILPQISGQALVLIVLGGLWLCLWHTRARALGLVIAAAGLALAPQAERPDVLIERDGGTAALRSGAGSLVFPPATAASYSVDNWLLADGDERAAEAVTDDSVFRCDSLGCIGVVKGKTVALIRHPGALEEDCRLADIVIAPFTIGKKCRAARVIVDRRMLKALGAHALYIEGLSIRTETVAASRGRRPWVPDRATVQTTRSPEADDELEASDRRRDGDPEE